MYVINLIIMHLNISCLIKFRHSNCNILSKESNCISPSYKALLFEWYTIMEWLAYKSV